MINVTIGESKTQSEKPFPKLMIHSGKKIIVLMLKNKCGSVLYSTSSAYGIGYYSEDWSTENFTDYNEPITLQNA